MNGEATEIQNGEEHLVAAAEPESTAGTNGSPVAQEHPQPNPVESSRDSE
jgi:hypothetical protein